jgi:hypothetical protein
MSDFGISRKTLGKNSPGISIPQRGRKRNISLHKYASKSYIQLCAIACKSFLLLRGGETLWYTLFIALPHSN